MYNFLTDPQDFRQKNTFFLDKNCPTCYYMGNEWESGQGPQQQNMGSVIMLIEEIQARLRDAIKNSGLSQKEVAQRIGVNPSTVSKYVRMEKSPSLDTFATLCRVLGISSDRILGLDFLPDSIAVH